MSDRGPLDEEGFRRFHRTTAPALSGYVRGLAGSTAEAEDLVQETYLLFLERAPEGLTTGQARAWIYTTATRLAREVWRRRDLAHRWEAGRPRPEPVTAPDPRSPDLEKALAHLSLRQRALLWLAYVEERSHREIASVVGVEPRSVRVLLHRARKRLEAVFRAMERTHREEEADDG